MLLQQFQQLIKEQFHLHPQQCKLLLAVSGGIDSVVLTDLVYKTGFDFIIAHCNFQLRAEESERDEAFVKAFAGKYNKEVLVKKFDTEKYAAENHLSIQEAARELRYEWFDEIMNYKLQTTNYKLVTAHHANDNIETLLMHFFRGTGIHGLTAIPAFDKERKIIRPLLFAKREDITAYAKENELAWAEDSSNASDKYTRNFFRLKLMPAIKEIFPNAEDNLLHNIHRFKETEMLYRQAIHEHKKKLVEAKGNEWHVPALKLKKSEPLHTILWEIIKDFGFASAQTDEVKKLLDADNGSYISSASHRIIKNRNWLIIAPLQTETGQNILIEKEDKKILFEKGNIQLEILSSTDYKLQTTNAVALINADEIKFPLLLRKWKQGDYFYPLGMQKKKKLSRFFIDQKLSKTEKENVWVIESNKKIIWVIGYRIDDRFKITGNTKNILRINFTK